MGYLKMDDNYRQYCIEKLREIEEIQDSVIQFMSSANKKLIYGSGRQACVCLEIFRNMGVEIDGILNFSTTERPMHTGYWGELIKRVNIYAVEEFVMDKTKYDVLISTERSMSEKTKEILYQQGFLHLYTCDWGSNKNMRDVALEVYEQTLNQIKEMGKT